MSRPAGRRPAPARAPRRAHRASRAARAREWIPVSALGVARLPQPLATAAQRAETRRPSWRSLPSPPAAAPALRPPTLPRPRPGRAGPRWQRRPPGAPPSSVPAPPAPLSSLWPRESRAPRPARHSSTALGERRPWRWGRRAGVVGAARAAAARPVPRGCPRSHPSRRSVAAHSRAGGAAGRRRPACGGRARPPPSARPAGNGGAGGVGRPPHRPQLGVGEHWPASGAGSPRAEPSAPPSATRAHRHPVPGASPCRTAPRSRSAAVSRV